MEFVRRIYGLYADGDRGIRYIGHTENIHKRFITHTRDRHLEGMSVKRLWVERCIAAGNVIRIRTLETVASTSHAACKKLAVSRESWWINRATLRGIRLLNGQRWFVGAAPASVCNAWDFVSRLALQEPQERRWREWQIVHQIEKDFPALRLLDYRYEKMYQMPTCM